MFEVSASKIIMLKNSSMNKEFMYQYISKIKQSSIGIPWGTKKLKRATQLNN